MTLNELLKQASDDEYFYIGSVSAFVFVGQKSELDYYLPIVSEEIKANMRKNLTRAEKLLKRHRMFVGDKDKMLADLNRFYYGSKLEYEINSLNDDVEHVKNKIEIIADYCSRMIKYLDNWQDFGNRQVLDYYDRMCIKPYGTVVILEGMESGDFWGLNERLKKYPKVGVDSEQES